MSLVIINACGTEFGYPEYFGDAQVTYLHGNPVSIVFENGVVEGRYYHSNGNVTRIMVNKSGSPIVIED